MTITSARITKQPRSLFDDMPRVFVTINGKEEFLFEYYPDEISFSESEFIGLTLEQAKHLKFKKDRDFLMS